MKRLDSAPSVPQVGLYWVRLEQKGRAAGGSWRKPPQGLNDAQGGSLRPLSPPFGYATLEDDGRAGTTKLKPSETASLKTILALEKSIKLTVK